MTDFKKAPKSVWPNKSAAKRDTRNPCAICGWGEHMAIHQFKEADFKPPFFPHKFTLVKRGEA